MKHFFLGLLLVGNILNTALAQEVVPDEIATGSSITLETDEGASSALVISNKSRANTLDLVILGAPTSGINVTLDGTRLPSLNGFFSIPPNSPNFRLQAFGDFAGATVIIRNITSSKNRATAEVLIYPPTRITH